MSKTHIEIFLQTILKVSQVELRSRKCDCVKAKNKKKPVPLSMSRPLHRRALHAYFFMCSVSVRAQRTSPLPHSHPHCVNFTFQCSLHYPMSSRYAQYLKICNIDILTSSPGHGPYVYRRNNKLFYSLINILELEHSYVT